MFIHARTKLCSVVLMICVGAGAWACNKSEAPPTVSSSEPESAQTAPQPAAKDVAAKANEASGTVTVSAAGTKFDPPVDKSKLPAGTWICDMGTVHFARTVKGDGKCPECGMNLTQLGASADGQAGAHAH